MPSSPGPSSLVAVKVYPGGTLISGAPVGALEPDWTRDGVGGAGSVESKCNWTCVKSFNKKQTHDLLWLIISSRSVLRIPTAIGAFSFFKTFFRATGCLVAQRLVSSTMRGYAGQSAFSPFEWTVRNENSCMHLSQFI